MYLKIHHVSLIYSRLRKIIQILKPLLKFVTFGYYLLNQARARLWARACFPEIVCVCVCMFVCIFVFPHPREQTFYLKLKSSLYTINKG